MNDPMNNSRQSSRLLDEIRLKFDWSCKETSNYLGFLSENEIIDELKLRSIDHIQFDDKSSVECKNLIEECLDYFKKKRTNQVYILKSNIFRINYIFIYFISCVKFKIETRSFFSERS
jgi:hypothetical protein